MHAPNKDVEDADHDLNFLTSDEFEAEVYLSAPNAPAQSYEAWTDALQTLPQTSQPGQRLFAPTNAPNPFPRSFSQPNTLSPSPPQAQTQLEVSYSGQESFAPANNFSPLPHVYTYKYPQQTGWDGQHYSHPVNIGQFSPRPQLYNTAQGLRPPQVAQELQGYIVPRPGESQPGPFHSTFNGSPSSYQNSLLPQTRASPTSAGHTFNATRATTENTGNAVDGDPFPQTGAYLASIGYDFNNTNTTVGNTDGAAGEQGGQLLRHLLQQTPNTTNFFVGSYAPASQNQTKSANIAIPNRQQLMDAPLMPPSFTRPLPKSKPRTQLTQHPPTQQWPTDNLQHFQCPTRRQPEESDQDLQMQKEQRRRRKEVRENTIAAGITVSQTPAVKPKPNRRSVSDVSGVVPLSKEKRQRLNSGLSISELFKPSNPPSALPQPRRPQFSSEISDLFKPVFPRQGSGPQVRKRKSSSSILERVTPVDQPSTPPQPHTPTFNAADHSSLTPPPKPRKSRKPTYTASTHTGARQLSINNPVPRASIPLVQLNHDELPQPIVEKYSDYKWSVYHYSILPLSGYDHAESWAGALLDQNPAADYEAHHFAHISQGFIQNGGAHSIIVLYNATNPFEYEPFPDTTTTIGVYGLHWHKHDEIHWTTLAKDVRSLFFASVQAEYIKLEHLWTFNDSKASEKRFHRAYWLAANRRDLGRLLNRIPSTDKQPYLIDDMSAEDPDKGFRISEEDLTNEWEMTAEQSEMAWQQVQEEVELLGENFDPSGRGWQHLVVGNTENF